MKCKISVNQLAEFSGASDAKKKRIVKQQVEPNRFLIPWYQRARGAMKKSLREQGSLKPILESMDILKKLEPEKDRAKIDKVVSLEALTRYVKMQLPSVLTEMDYEIVKPEIKDVDISDVRVIVAPDVVVRGQSNGRQVIGAIKIHIAKSSPFDIKKGGFVASTLFQYLKEKVALDNEKVLPELCICLDIFSGRVIQADKNNEATLSQVNEFCDEIKIIWNANNN